MTILVKLIAEHNRVAIVGGPRTGKTTLSEAVKDRPVIHTDDWIEEPWEKQPHILIDQTKGLDRYLVEGVQVPRFLRKCAQLKLPCPVDAVAFLTRTHGTLNARQKGMAKAINTVFDQWQSYEPSVPVVYFWTSGPLTIGGE